MAATEVSDPSGEDVFNNALQNPEISQNKQEDLTALKDHQSVSLNKRTDISNFTKLQ